MASSSQESVTRLLAAMREGDPNAANALFPLVYDELRALAHRKRQGWHGDETLNTTALVHEAYLKLIGQPEAAWESRSHFFAVAAKAMRHILITYAERRQRQKRGGDQQKVSLDELEALMGNKGLAFSEERTETLLVLDEALQRLERHSERQGRIVECRFFGGMTIQETAAALRISPATVKRGWMMAQAWLYREIESDLAL